MTVRPSKLMVYNFILLTRSYKNKAYDFKLSKPDQTL